MHSIRQIRVKGTCCSFTQADALLADAGWTHARNSRGAEGLVPTSYLKQLGPSPPILGAARPSANGSSSSSSRVNYAFESGGPGELTVAAGEMVERTGKAAVGEGWTEVRRGDQTGLIPSWALEG